MRLFSTWLASLCSAIIFTFLTVTPAFATSNVDTTALRGAVTVGGVRFHQAEFQAIADGNGGVRTSGTAGFDASAAYVAAQMEAAGYVVTVQPFTFPFFEELSPAVFEQLAPAPQGYPPTDFATMNYSGSGDVTALIQGVDITIPPGVNANTSNSGCEPLDFAGFTPGRIALIQRGSCLFQTKAANAEAAGAVGVIIFNEGQAGRTDAILGTLGNPLVTVPVIAASYGIGESLYNASLGTDVTVRIFVDAISAYRNTHNLIAELSGHQDRVVVAGAHLDSVPSGPGINDNGSGSAALLEIALQMKALNITPRNTVRFAWWGAEEAGLVGSNFYVNSLTIDEIKNIGAYLEFEMLGSPNFVRFVFDGDGSDSPLPGPEGSANIEQVINDYFTDQGLPFEPTPLDLRHSYLAFTQAGIPAGGLFGGDFGIKTTDQASIFGGTAGDQYDPCYHLACDTFNNVSLQALDEMSDAAAHVILTLAMTRNTMPKMGSRQTTCEDLGYDFSLKVDPIFCRKSPNYWAKHPQAWPPVGSIDIGGVSYSKDAAISMMKTKAKGDKSYALFNEQVAAKLNVLVCGPVSSEIDAIIDDADDWLALNPPGSGVRSKDPEWNDGSVFFSTLKEFNGGVFLSGIYPIDGLGFVEIDTVDGIYFDWVSTRSADAVIVKGGNSVNLYEYDPESFGDIDLHAPINPKNDTPYGLSYVEFCFDWDIEIIVRKFHDVDGDGEWDPDEPEIGVDEFIFPDGTIGGTSGWPYLFTYPMNGGSATDLFWTPGTHEHSFAGVYTVEEFLLPLLWEQTALFRNGVPQPISAQADISYAGDADESHEVIFGNIGYAEIMGRKFEDLDADGLWDPAEPGLPGVTIELMGDIDGDGDDDVVSIITDANGEFSFTGLVPGIYTVTETVWPAGSWIPSTPISSGPHNLGAGDNLDLGWVFGNFLTASFLGHKFDDLDGNGGDDSEPRLSGWTIELWDVSDAPVILASTLTDGSGLYAYTGIAPGDTWAICELLTAGYEQTFPSLGTVPQEGVQLFDCTILGTSYGPYGYQITPSSGDEFIDNHFGNFQSESAELQISKTDDVDPIVAGNTLTYTITVNNAGPSDAQNVVVTDTLPAGVTFVATSGCGSDPNGVPTCNLGDISSGGSAQFTIQVTVDSGTSGTITNSTSVTSDTPDSSPGNNSTTEDTTVNQPEADLSISKADDVDPIVAGNTLTYTVTVNNAGPQDAQNVVVTDTLPAGVIFVATSGCSNDTNGVPTCNLGPIASGGSAQFTIQVTVDSGTSGTITNSTSVTSDTPDTTPGNNSTTEDTTVNPDTGNQPPDADPDFYDATGNVGISIGAGAGLLSNDSDPDLPSQVLTATAETVASGNGGSATIATDGSFSYTPPPGYKGSDTFSYTLNDDAGGSAVGTVTITLDDMIWFIDNSLGAPGDGSLAAPFNTLPGFEASVLPGTGDCIFVEETGNGAYNGPLTLQSNQVLVGKGATADIPTVCNITLPTGSETLPATLGSRPSIISASDGIILADTNTIRGLDLGDNGGTGFKGTAVGTLTISEVSIGDGTPSGGAIEVSTSGTLAVTFDSLSASSSTDEGIRLSGVDGTFSITGTSGTIQTTNVPAIDIDGNPSVALGVALTSVSANGATNGIILMDTTGSFVVTGDGGGTANASGGTIQNTTGVGISLTNARDISLTQLDVNGTGDHGIDIATVTNLTFQDAAILNAGNADDEHSVRIVDLFGNSLIEDVQIDDINEDAVEYYNFGADDGVRDVLTIRRVDFEDHTGAGFGEHGIDVRSHNASLMGLVVDDSSFSINPEGALGVLGASVGGSNLSITIQNSTFNALDSFGAGTIQISNTATSTGTNMITGNTINDTAFIGIIVNNDDESTSEATITDNTINGDGTLAQNGFGIQARQDENGSYTLLINNNDLDDFGFDYIRVFARDTTDGTGILNGTITANTSTIAPNDIGPGINDFVQDTNTICADINGNNIMGSNTFPGFGFDDDIIVSEAGSATLNIEQTSSANLSTVNNSATVFVGGTPVFAAANCSTPSP